MEGFKPTSTTMDPYVKLRIDDPSEEVDATLYHKLFSILPYLCSTHLDLSYVINVLSEFMVKSKKVHWQVGKMILRYLSHTISHGLTYERGDNIFFAWLY